MPYLLLQDYKKLIQSDNLAQVIGNDYTQLTSMQVAAITEASSYLRQKWDVSAEFKSVEQWDPAVIYKATDRIFVDAADYNPSRIPVYAQGEIAKYNGRIYIANTSTTGSFILNQWTDIGPVGSLFYGKYPAPLFSYINQYAKNAQVYYKGRIYTAQRQYNGKTYLPNDATNGFYYWGAGTAYTIPAGTLLSNTTYWTPGDNRNQQLLNYIIDITLYHIHSRIAPRNIPDLRVKRYDDAIKWFKDASRGDNLSIDLPVIAPETSMGRRIRWGGSEKQPNTY